MQTYTNDEGLTIINFGIGSANTARIMDLLSECQPRAVIFLGKCGWLKGSIEISLFIYPLRLFKVTDLTTIISLTMF